MRKLIILIASLAIAVGAGAQTIPVNPKFGAVSDLELDMTTYEPDTSAVALVLYRSQELNLIFNHSLDIVQEITVHERIKVLKEDGKQYADYSFLYYRDHDIKESYSGVKVETFNREGGKVVRTKMSKKYEFDDVYSDNIRKHSFTAENVKVGSVIEVTYRFTSPRYWDIDDLYLQDAIPVNEAVVDVGYAEYFRVNRNQRGSIPVTFRSENTLQYLSLNGDVLNYNMTRDVFRATDIPALPEESHSFNASQYRGAVIYDMSGLVFPGSAYKSFSQTWADVDKAVASSDLVGACKEKFKDIKALEEVLAGAERDDMRIAAVCQWISGLVKWDKKSRLIPQSTKETLKQGSGSDADLNALVASALSAAGFRVEPVLIRRRTSGILMQHHISIQTFDTFILRVSSPDGSQSWYVDAARPEGYLNILHPDFLSNHARVIRSDGTGEWADLTPLARGTVSQAVNARIQEDCTLTGKADVLAVYEDSYSLKASYNDFDTEDAFLEDIEQDEGLEILDYSVRKDFGHDAAFSYSFKKDVDVSGERIYIHPFFSEFHSPSAFRKEERKIPVDFPYQSSLNYAFSLEIPEGYVVEEIPENVSFTCPPVGGRVLLQTQILENKISLIYRFSLKDMIVLPEHYADLRAFWETAVGIENSIIVLKKQ